MMCGPVAVLMLLRKLLQYELRCYHQSAELSVSSLHLRCAIDTW